MLIVLFVLIVAVMLLLDLGVFNKNSHQISSKEALIWSIVWITLSMLFSGLIYWQSGFERFAQFQSAYWIEKALSVDNLFVFILVFNYFNVLGKNQHKVLFWGVIGAIILRALFIFTGVELINLSYVSVNLFGHLYNINILLTVFGLFLVYAGIKSAFAKEDDDEDKDFSKSPGAKLIYWLFPRVTKNLHGDKFFVKKKVPVYKSGDWITTDREHTNRRVVGSKLVTYATPLLVVVGVIEFTDLLFAVDSIPAIFAVAPRDPFILYSSNIFAILGLRSLYFLLANFIQVFKYLKYGLAVILTFIGIKMLIDPVLHISSPISLFIVIGVLILSTIISLIFKDKKEEV